MTEWEFILQTAYIFFFVDSHCPPPPNPHPAFEKILDFFSSPMSGKTIKMHIGVDLLKICFCIYSASICKIMFFSPRKCSGIILLNTSCLLFSLFSLLVLLDVFPNLLSFSSYAVSLSISPCVCLSLSLSHYTHTSTHCLLF